MMSTGLQPRVIPGGPSILFRTQQASVNIEVERRKDRKCVRRLVGHQVDASRKAVAMIRQTESSEVFAKAQTVIEMIQKCKSSLGSEHS